MAWGSNPQFTISGELSYERCAQLFVPDKRTGMFNISTQRPTRSNYHIRQVHDRNGKVHGYALKMYNTDIITWFRDSSVRYVKYDSAITYAVQNKFGPLNIWRYNRANFRCTARFGRWGSGVSYPFVPSGHEMTISKDGHIRGLFDERRRIIPDRRPGRREKLKKFRAAALGRVLLGEFPGLVEHGQHGFRRRMVTGWWSLLPTNRMSLFILFMDGAGFTEIDGWLMQNKLYPVAVSTTKNEALAKTVHLLGKSAMDIYADTEWHRTNYAPVYVRDL